MSKPNIDWPTGSRKCIPKYTTFQTLKHFAESPTKRFNFLRNTLTHTKHHPSNNQIKHPATAVSLGHYRTHETNLIQSTPTIIKQNSIHSFIHITLSPKTKQLIIFGHQGRISVSLLCSGKEKPSATDYELVTAQWVVLGSIPAARHSRRGNVIKVLPPPKVLSSDEDEFGKRPSPRVIRFSLSRVWKNDKWKSGSLFVWKANIL